MTTAQPGLPDVDLEHTERALRVSAPRRTLQRPPSPPALRPLDASGAPGHRVRGASFGGGSPWALVLDEVGDRLGVSSALTRAGYRAEQAVDADQALAILRRRAPQVVVVDTHDEASTVALVRRIRDLSDVPVLVLGPPTSAALAELLGTGGTDVLAKPFTTTQLAGRLATLRPASEGPPRTPDTTDGYLELDAERRSAVVDGSPLSLTPTEWELLAMLAEHPGEQLGLPQLLEGSPTTDCGLERLRFVVLRLRRKLGHGDPERSPVEVVGGDRFVYRRPR